MSLLLPGLRGDDALGFLAAIGLISLSEQGEIAPISLAWRAAGTPVAQVDGVDSVDELGGQLRTVLDRLSDEGAVIPGVEPSFPLATAGGTTDPMRMGRVDLLTLYRDADEAWLKRDNPWPARWLIGLTAHSAIKNETRGDVELTPFYAPTGRMAMRTSIFDKTVEALEAVEGPADALTHWHRTSYDGANFDERAKRDAGVTTNGEANNQGAPSPTWLAAMSLRFFPLTDDGRNSAAVRWERVRLYPGYTTRSLVWPVWDPFLDAAAIRALFGHPAMRLVTARDEHPLPESPAELAGLGVTAVFGASRRTLSQGDGPIGPAVRIWPTPPATARL